MKQELRTKLSERQTGHLPVFAALSVSFKFNSVKRRQEKQMNIYPSYYRTKKRETCYDFMSPAT